MAAPHSDPKAEAEARLAERERQLKEKADPYLATLVTEAKSAIRQGKYDLACGLLTDDCLAWAHQNLDQ